MSESAAARERFPLAQPGGRGPLEGVRIVDAGQMVSAPFSTVLLADFGADVIKIEHPTLGDNERKLPPFKKLASGVEVPLWWKNGARNKRCITLNLGKPEGAKLFRQLVEEADAVVENYRPGTFEKWGLGYEELSKVNPKIILLSISGFGQTGPMSSLGGFGRVAEAFGGLTNLIGQKGGTPFTPGVPFGDLVTGLLGSWALMVALYYRDARGGVGQHIDLGLYESIFRILEFDPIQYDQVDDLGERVHTREGNQMSYVAPSDMFRTQDGFWFTLTASQQSIFEDLCDAMGRPDLLKDPRFIDNYARVINKEEINRIVAEWIAQRTREDVERVIADKGLPGSHVNNMEDVFRNEQYLAREMLVRVLDTELGDAVVQNAIPKFSKTPGSVRHLGPRLGEHNEEVYRDELGLSAGELTRLKEMGVI